MAYGLNLYFPGYPTINLAGMVPYAPLGTICDSYRNLDSSGYAPTRNVSWNYPIGAPSGASVYANCSVHSWSQRAQGLPKIIFSMSASRSSGSYSWRPARPVTPTDGNPIMTVSTMVATGNYSNVNNNGTYGLLVQNQGIQSILNGNPVPMVVKGKYEYSVPAGTFYKEYNLPALSGINFAVAQPYAVYIGCKNNNVACYGFLRPRGTDTTSWSAGATLRVYFFNPSYAHASYTSREYNLHLSQTSTTLYIIVAGKNTATPSGYGLATYNTVGNMTMAPNAVPVLPKAVIWTKPTYYSKPGAVPGMLGSAESLPSGISSSDTCMMQVGANTSSHLGWVYPFQTYVSNIYLGDTVTYIYGSQVRTKLWYDYATGFSSQRNDTGWSNFVNTSYCENVRRPILVVRGEDYFTSL